MTYGDERPSPDYEAPAGGAPVHQQKAGGRGCLFWGCITALVLIVVLIVGGYFGIQYGINRMIANYTSETPMELPEIDMTDAQIDAVESRVQAFIEHLESGETTGSLTLNTRELNGILLRANEIEPEERSFHFDLEDDTLAAWISVSIDEVARQAREEQPELELPERLQGRYFNGKGWFSVDLRNGDLWVEMIALEVNDQPVPEFVTDAFAGENVAQDMEMSEDMERGLALLEDIRVESQQMVFEPKPEEELQRLAQERAAGQLPPPGEPPVEPAPADEPGAAGAVPVSPDLGTTPTEPGAAATTLTFEDAGPTTPTEAGAGATTETEAAEQPVVEPDGEAGAAAEPPAGDGATTEAEAGTVVGPTAGETAPAAVTEESVP